MNEDDLFRSTLRFNLLDDGKPISKQCAISYANTGSRLLILADNGTIVSSMFAVWMFGTIPPAWLRKARLTIP